MRTLTLNVGLAAKLKAAFARNGWTEKLIDKACEGDNLGQFRQVLLGRAFITMHEPRLKKQQAVVAHVIDCNADPYLPDDWRGIEEHQKGGSFTWLGDSPSQVSLYLSDPQQKGSYMRGHRLRRELAGKPVLNANVLDYLLAHPELIPESWKGKYVFFWGTIYRDSGGNLCVRDLFWYNGWRWAGFWLSVDFYNGYPAALRAS